MRCWRTHDRTGARIELGAVTRTHNEVGSRGIANRASRVGTDGVVDDEAALSELEHEAGVTSLWIREAGRFANRHLGGQANRSPHRCRRARSRRPGDRRRRTRPRGHRRNPVRRGKRDALAPGTLCPA